MERETRTFTTPAGHELVVYSYITGLERRQLQYPYFREGSEGFNESDLKLKGKAGAVRDEAQDLALNLIIVSIDGHKSGDTVDGPLFTAAAYVLGLPSKESAFIIKKIDEITSDRDYEEKKTS
jgi:hypothetical protein